MTSPPVIGPRKKYSDLFPKLRAYHMGVDLDPNVVALEKFIEARNWAYDLYCASPIVERFALARPLEEFFYLSSFWISVVDRELLTGRTIDVEYALGIQVPSRYRKLVAANLALDPDAFLHWIDICFRTHENPPRRRLETRLTIDDSWVAAEDYRTILTQFTGIGEAPPPTPAETDIQADDAALAALAAMTQGNDTPQDARISPILRLIRALSHLHTTFVLRQPNRPAGEPLSPAADVADAALHAGSRRAGEILATFGLTYPGPLEDLACMANMTTAHAIDVITAELAKADAAHGPGVDDHAS